MNPNKITNKIYKQRFSARFTSDDWWRLPNRFGCTLENWSSISEINLAKQIHATGSAHENGTKNHFNHTILMRIVYTQLALPDFWGHFGRGIYFRTTSRGPANVYRFCPIWQFLAVNEDVNRDLPIRKLIMPTACKSDDLLTADTVACESAKLEELFLSHCI